MIHSRKDFKEIRKLQVVIPDANDVTWGQFYEFGEEIVPTSSWILYEKLESFSPKLAGCRVDNFWFQFKRNELWKLFHMIGTSSQAQALYSIDEN